MRKSHCVVVIPSGIRRVPAASGQPEMTMDFDALFKLAYEPVLRELGYVPMCVDPAIGALLVEQWLTRFVCTDLVLVDVTLASGDVYSDVGLRHAARTFPGVRLVAGWSRRMAGVAEWRAARYLLPDDDLLGARSVTEIQRTLRQALAAHLRPTGARGAGHWIEQIEGQAVFREELFRLGAAEACPRSDDAPVALRAAFQAELRRVREAPSHDRMGRARALIATCERNPLSTTAAAALASLLADCCTGPGHWLELMHFIDRLPAELRATPEVAVHHSTARAAARRERRRSPCPRCGSAEPARPRRLIDRRRSTPRAAPACRRSPTRRARSRP